MIENERIHNLNNKGFKETGKYVLYMMQASQRISYNHAFYYAVDVTKKKNIPMFVGFALIPSYPNANWRHYSFMFDGLWDVEKELSKLNIPFVVLPGSYEKVVLDLSKDACLVVTDFGYTKYQIEIRDKASKDISCGFVAVESDVVVPVKVASNKLEPYAMTIRPKILKNMNRFLNKLPVIKKGFVKGYNGFNKSVSFGCKEDFKKYLKKYLKIDFNIKPSLFFTGGYTKAKEKLDFFIKNKLIFYNQRNDPSQENTSDLSPYLHFGNISPLEIILEVIKANVEPEIKDSFINECVIWRELSRNFTYYSENYLNFSSIPQWAYNEFLKHSNDKRDYIYSLDVLENAQTHDIYWNAAQKELLIKGKIHNYMRMYWGKKVIEWSKDFRKAFDVLIYLNDKYALDGRDPNGHASIRWCFGGHDRPFFERPIFGKVRYMSSYGLEKKFKIMDYVNRINNLYEK